MHVRLSNVTVEYPIFTSQTRAIRTALYSHLGGKLATHNQTVVVRALNDVSVELQEGDRLGIVGHNGSGKTTLLRVISGVYQPQRGDVDVAGRLSSYTDITLGMEPEESGWDNIVARCAFMGMSFAEGRRLAPAIAEFSELGQYLDIPVRSYSTGMFVRLAFAIATSIRPDIIVMDELIGAGDKQFIAKARQRLIDLLDETKIVVLASHFGEVLKQLCNKGLWLEKGQVRGFGPIHEILEQYEASQAHVQG